MPAADSSLASATPAELFHALLESTDGAIVTTSLDGVILSWDAAAQGLYGFSAADVVGQPLSSYVPADRAGEAVRCLHAVAIGDRVGPIETVRLHRDKTRIEVSFTAAGIHDSSGRVAGALFVERDIGAKKAIERSLQESRGALSDSEEFLAKAERLSETSSWTLQLVPEPLLVCSPESYRILGLEDGTPLSVELFFSFVHPDDREQVELAMTLAVTEHCTYEVEYRLVCPDQSIRWVHSWAEAEFDELGEPQRVLGVVQDITKRHHADEALRSSERRFRLLAENARDLIFRYTLVPEARLEYISPAATDITGYTPDELYADPSLASALMGPEAQEQLENAVASADGSEPVDIPMHRRDGSLVWVSHSQTLIHDETGELIAVEGIVRDVTERKRAEEARTHAGLYDALTGLSNRVLLREHLDRVREDAQADGRSVVVVLLDLDDFTLVNDTHGHEAGDAVLVRVAELLTVASGVKMTVARTGSDEFAIVGDDAQGPDTAVLLVHRIRSALSQPIAVGGVELFVRAHIGVAVGDPSASCDSLLRSAELALGNAKRQNSTTGVEFFTSEMRTDAIQRLALVADLQQALARDEFEILYQPIVGLADDQIIGAEALLRWRHSRLGVVSPAAFIPLAEDTGLIIEIGAWVLDQACTRIRQWSDEVPALAHVGISVNLSVKQLRSEGIVDTVAATIARAGIDPGRLTIEMTESVAAEDLDTVRDILTRIRDLGARTAIDDFGTGYSSLAYLKNLPLDTLKIDQVFVAGLGNDPRDSAIVASTITVAKALGLFTIAEGVETPAQLAALRALGCHAAQGFLFSEPITGDDLEALRLPARRAVADADATPVVQFDDRERATIPNGVPAAVLEATRSLFWLRTAADARRIAETLVREVGGTTKPRGTEHDLTVIPADISFGAGEPVLASAPPRSNARRLLDEHLSTFLLDARRVLELSGRTERLAETAATDMLTALPNRRMVERALGRLHDDDTVIMIDLDHFKRVNDEHGHAAGDDVLRAFGAVLRGEVRASDVVGRYGGEEFVVVLTGRGGADAFLERLREGWSACRPFPISFSAGIARFAGRADETMSMADDALYRAKAAGRDQWMWATVGAPGAEQSRDCVAAYLADAVIGHRRPAIRLALDLLDRRVPRAAIVEDLLGAAQREVGERWYRQELTPADEHVASGVAAAALDAIASETSAKQSDGRVVVACAEGDWHSLAAQMFGESLRAHNVNVTVLGASTPADAVGEFLTRTAADALAISCSVPMYLAGAARLIDVAHLRGIPVIVGGRGFGNDSRRADHLGADAWALSAADAGVILAGWKSEPPLVLPSPVAVNPVALRLATASEAMADAALRELTTTFAPTAGFDERRLARTREDLAFIVQFLAAATLTADPALFTEFLDWLEALLTNRGAPPQSLLHGLDALRAGIQTVDLEALRLLDKGREHLRTGTNEEAVNVSP